MQLPKEATFYDYLSAEYAEDEVTETLIDPLSAEGVSAMSSKDNSSHSSRKSHASGSSYGDGDMFGEVDPDYGEMLWDEKSGKKQKKKKRFSSKGSKAAAEGSSEGDEGGRVMRARCWMAQDFPMKLSQLLPLLDVIGTANKHMEKVSKFLSKYSKMDMFPVKLQVGGLNGSGGICVLQCWEECRCQALRIAGGCNSMIELPCNLLHSQQHQQ